MDLSLSERLKLHSDFCSGVPGGVRFDATEANLTGANLYRANLTDANLTDANLNGANLYRANLTDANLNGANLYRAYLNGANLYRANINGCIGNMEEIKTAQFDTWSITWTRSPEGIDYLQIGCQRHSLLKWKQAEPRWIAAMDPAAPEWWKKYGQIVIQLVEASPAVAWGSEVNEQMG